VEDGDAAVAAAGHRQTRTCVLLCQVARARNKAGGSAVTDAMSTLAAGTRSLLPALLLVLLVSVLVLVVLPAVLAAAGGTAA
jgi:hypothetical protein